jgi:hypothetical protein
MISEAAAAQVASLAPEAKAAARTQMEKFYPKEEVARVFDAPPAAPNAPVPKAEAPAKPQEPNEQGSATFPIPPTPEGYRFNYSPERLAMDTGALAKFAGDLRTALHAAQVPTLLAQGVLDGLDASAALYPPDMIEQERNATIQEQGWQLIRAHGQAGAKEVIELASAAYFRLPEAFRTKIDQNYGFHSAQAQTALAAIEREYRHRTGAKK